MDLTELTQGSDDEIAQKIHDAGTEQVLDGVFAGMQDRFQPDKATGLSFALCFVFLLFLPSHPWGMALMIAVSTLLLLALGQSGDVGVSAITIGAVMVIAALGPHEPWKQPLIGAVATAVGIAIGFAASWFANVKLLNGLRREPSVTETRGLRYGG